MKKILITGDHSYIGDSFKQFLTQWVEEYEVETVSLMNDQWKNKAFSEYDSIFHVAGIAHRKENAKNAHEYYEINRDLAVKVAQKAKDEGVKQFIFLSSGSIYGIETGMITKNTPVNPKSHYGKSKVEAEEKLRNLESESFKVAILRPLMVYGKGCKGNFQTIIKIVKKSPVFPRIHNNRSLIYIDNLCSFVKMIIDHESYGTYFPRNRENVDTYEIAKGVAEAMGKKLYMSWLLGGIIYIFRGGFSTTRKAFTDLVYKDTDEFKYMYCIKDTYDSIRESV